jgi:Transglutaminase-like superfamily
MSRRCVYCLVLIIPLLSLSSCEKVPIGHDSDILSFPVGRSFLSASTLKVTLAGSNYDAHYTFDSCGGYWVHIPKTLVSEGDIIRIRFARKSEELHLFSELVGNKPAWVNPSHYIDSDHEDIVAKANELTAGLSSNIEKAKKLQTYVIQHVYLKIYMDASLDKASITNELGYGTCMNSSRLYIALCRAVNIPARSVWGVVNAHEEIGGYNNHHQWAEILGDSGHWHPCDFGYTIDFDLNDLRYLDLIYAAEENTILKNRNEYHIMIEGIRYTHDYPTVLDGKIRFRIEDDCRPDSMVVEYSYEY